MSVKWTQAVARAHIYTCARAR